MAVNLSLTLDGRGRPVTPTSPLPIGLLQGELVKVALRSGSYSTYVAGTSTTSLIIQGQIDNRDDGSPCVQLTVPSGTTQGAAIQAVVYGKVIGVRWRRDSTAPPVFSVVIDGVSYAVSNASYRYNGVPVSLITDGDAYHIIANDLADGPHNVEIIVASDPLGAATYKLSVYGFIAERRVGYTERKGFGNSLIQGVLTGTDTNIVTSTVTAPALRKVVYTNTGAAGIVTVTYGSSVVWQAALGATGTAGCSDSFDPGDYVAFSQYKHSGATTIRFTAYGRS